MICAAEPRAPESAIIHTGIDRLARLGRADRLHHLFGDPFGAVRPHVDDLVVLLALGDEAVEILLLVLLHLIARLVDELLLGGGDDEIVLAERDAGLARLLEADRHQPVAEDDRLLLAAMAIDLVDDVADLLLGEEPVHDVEGYVGIVRQDVREHHPAGRRLDTHHPEFAVLVVGLDPRGDPRLERDAPGLERMLDLAHVGERHAFAGLARALEGDVVEAEDDVLRGHDDRLAVRGRQYVVGRHHEDARLELRLERQGHVHGHLVAVEVGVEGGADQRMKLDRLAFDEDRLERLDAEAVQASARD